MLLQGGVFLPDPAERDQARGRMRRGGDAVVIVPAEDDGISAPIPRLDNTDMTASIDENARKKLYAQIPLGKPGTPKEKRTPINCGNS